MAGRHLLTIPRLAQDNAPWAPTIAALGEAACCSVGNTLPDVTLPGMAAHILCEAPPGCVRAKGARAAWWRSR